MSRQYFADTLTEPVNAAYTTITATSETVLVPTVLTGIPANEPRAGKVYELTVGGTVTTGASGTMIITPRYGLVIGGTTLGASPTQTVVPSITTAPFLYRCLLVIRSVGLPGANSTVVCTGKWKAAALLRRPLAKRRYRIAPRARRFRSIPRWRRGCGSASPSAWRHRSFRNGICGGR